MEDQPKKKRGLLFKLLIGAGAIFGLCIVVSIIGAALSDSDDTPSAIVAEVSDDTSVVEDTVEPEDTAEPVPTETSEPTNTPYPTNTPLPPTPTPEPIILTGSGDMVVDFENPFDNAIVHIVGNAASRHFGVKGYGSDGDSNLLVNTTDSYDGIRPLDFMIDEHTTRFEINAVGEWTIEVLPLLSARILEIPGEITGSGDDVIIIYGSTPDLARIAGNASGRHFAVIGYGSYRDLLVNTTDPYEGTVPVDSTTQFLEITGEGEWSIEVTEK